MLYYRQQFNLGSGAKEAIQIPVLFSCPQLIIYIGGNQNSIYSGELRQIILSSEVYFKIIGEVQNLGYGHQHFAPRFGEQYYLEFQPFSKLQFLELMVWDIDLPRLN